MSTEESFKLMRSGILFLISATVIVLVGYIVLSITNAEPIQSIEDITKNTTRIPATINTYLPFINAILGLGLGVRLVEFIIVLLAVSIYIFPAIDILKKNYPDVSGYANIFLVGYPLGYISSLASQGLISGLVVSLIHYMAKGKLTSDEVATLSSYVQGGLGISALASILLLAGLVGFILLLWRISSRVNLPFNITAGAITVFVAYLLEQPAILVNTTQLLYPIAIVIRIIGFTLMLIGFGKTASTK